MAARAPKFTVPDLTNATDGFLIDEIAKHRVMMNWLKRSEAVHKEALYARIGREAGDRHLKGERFELVGVTQVVQSRLDTEKIKTNMSPEWVAEYSKDSSYQTLNFDALNVGVGYDELRQWLHHLDSELFE